MTRFGSLVLVALAVSLVPTSAPAQQFVLRDDVSGWGWLALVPTSRAIVQLAFGSPQSGDQGRLDLRVLNDLRSSGVRRIWGAGDFEPSENQVLGECAAIDYSAPGAEGAVYAIHTEVSYWDLTRLAATEIFESLTLNRVAPTDLTTDTFVDACVDQLRPVLIRLGFDQG
jgi:hypothetical protein